MRYVISFFIVVYNACIRTGTPIFALAEKKLNWFVKGIFIKSLQRAIDLLPSSFHDVCIDFCSIIQPIQIVRQGKTHTKAALQ